MERMGISGVRNNLCRLCGETVETLPHILLDCAATKHARLLTLQLAECLVPGLVPETALRLDLGDTDVLTDVAVSTIIGTGFQLIWKKCLLGKGTDRHETWATLEAVVNILRRSRNKVAGEMIADTLSVTQ